ncbi:hypothetical protein L1987_37934 [Smallanthus sonchifolius]|uniref:Uncharacterized protein n=1 Tax=Smallanthus sonchifolius TaxID=185202 RepID=A0ACB9HIM7_9ASTR|nr:hypothetical protein L1987_37934 [Smallanthus sonchifolius]
MGLSRGFQRLTFPLPKSNLHIKMASAAAARSFLRSSSVRNAAARISSDAKRKAGPSPSPFRFSTTKPLSHRIFRCPVEMSACIETMPFHTATASALMTSMLAVSRSGYGWLPEGVDDTS